MTTARSLQNAAIRSLALVLGTFAFSCGPKIPVSAPLPDALESLSSDVAQRIRKAAQSLEDAPSAASWGHLGRVYEANELLQLADECYAIAVLGAPEDASWPYHRAITQSKLGQLGQAVESMENALERAPTYAPCAWRLGGWLLELERFGEARAYFQRATELAPNDPAGWAGLARVHLELDETSLAVKAATRFQSLATEEPYAHYLLGTALRALGRNEEARLHLALGQASRPSWTDPWQERVSSQRGGSTPRLAYAKRLVAQKRSAEAVPILQQLSMESPQDVALLNNLALAQSGAGDHLAGVRTLEHALEVEPRNLRSHLNLAVLLDQLNETARALKAVDAAIAIEPTWGKAHDLRGALLKKANRPNEALLAYEQALRHDDRNERLRSSIGFLQLDLSRWDEAVISFERATKSPTASADAFLGLAFARSRLGNTEAAERALREALNRKPSNSQLLKIVQQEVASGRR